MPVKMTYHVDTPEGGAGERFEHRFGRAIYNEYSITGLNKLPVAILTAFIMHGSEPNVPFDLENLVTSLLVEGSVALSGGAFMQNIVFAEDGRFIRDVSATSGDGMRCIWREYTSSDGRNWAYQDYEDYGEDGQKKLKSGKFPNEIILYPNGTGVLEPIQRQYWRLEQIAGTLQRMTTGEGTVEKLISGLLGANQTLDSALRSGKKNIRVSGFDVQVHDLSENKLANHLISQFETLVPLYMRDAHIVETEGAGNISGVSRRILMLPMTTFVETVRKWVQEFIALAGGTVAFQQILVRDVGERRDELELLRELRNENVITQDEYRARARQLV